MSEHEGLNTQAGEQKMNGGLNKHNRKDERPDQIAQTTNKLDNQPEWTGTQWMVSNDNEPTKTAMETTGDGLMKKELKCGRRMVEQRFERCPKSGRNGKTMVELAGMVRMAEQRCQNGGS